MPFTCKKKKRSFVLRFSAILVLITYSFWHITVNGQIISQSVTEITTANKSNSYVIAESNDLFSSPSSVFLSFLDLIRQRSSGNTLQQVIFVCLI